MSVRFFPIVTWEWNKSPGSWWDFWRPFLDTLPLATKKGRQGPNMAQHTGSQFPVDALPKSRSGRQGPSTHPIFQKHQPKNVCSHIRFFMARFWSWNHFKSCIFSDSFHMLVWFMKVVHAEFPFGPHPMVRLMVLKGPAHQEPVVSLMRAFSKGKPGCSRCKSWKARTACSVSQWGFQMWSTWPQFWQREKSKMVSTCFNVYILPSDRSFLAYIHLLMGVQRHHIFAGVSRKKTSQKTS